MPELKTIKHEANAIESISQNFQYEHVLTYGIDTFFLARESYIQGPIVPTKASKYWKVISNIPYPQCTITLPKNRVLVGIYSKYIFEYPRAHFYFTLPSLTVEPVEAEKYFYFGLENGSNAFGGIATFLLYSSSTVSNQLRFNVGPLNGIAYISIDVAKPADFNTAKHHYVVMVSRNAAFGFIDRRLRVVALQCSEGTPVKVVENVLPYSIALIPKMGKNLSLLIELYAYRRTAVASSDLIVNLSYHDARIVNGSETIPLSLPLYLNNSDTVLQNYSISSGSVTSHPIPIFGYERKEIIFMANQAGTLDVQIYSISGNWRSIGSVSISANTLQRIEILHNAPLARVVFTPSTYPCTILEAFANLI
jgi:hypothetical protein